MRYVIRVLGDQDLPREHDWVLLEFDDMLVFCVKASCMTAPVVGEVWAAYRLTRALKVSENSERIIRHLIAI